MGRIARENAFALQYEKMIQGYLNDITYQELTQITNEFKDTDKTYIDIVLNGIQDKMEFFNELLTRYAKGYSLSRIYKIDKAILLIAMYEILYMKNIPYKVSINEALELAKKYSTDNSPVFINGVLAAIIKDKESILNESEDN